MRRIPKISFFKAAPAPSFCRAAPRRRCGLPSSSTARSNFSSVSLQRGQFDEMDSVGSGNAAHVNFGSEELDLKGLNQNLEHDLGGSKTRSEEMLEEKTCREENGRIENERNESFQDAMFFTDAVLDTGARASFTTISNLSKKAMARLKERETPAPTEMTSYVSLLSLIHSSHLTKEQIARLTFPPKFRDVIAHTDVAFACTDDELAQLCSAFDRLDLMNKKVAHQLYMAAYDQYRFRDFSLPNLVTFASGFRQFRDQHPNKKVFVDILMRLLIKKRHELAAEQLLVKGFLSIGAMTPINQSTWIKLTEYLEQHLATRNHEELKLLPACMGALEMTSETLFMKYCECLMNKRSDMSLANMFYILRCCSKLTIGPPGFQQNALDILLNHYIDKQLPLEPSITLSWFRVWARLDEKKFHMPEIKNQEDNLYNSKDKVAAREAARGKVFGRWIESFPIQYWNSHDLLLATTTLADVIAGNSNGYWAGVSIPGQSLQKATILLYDEMLEQCELAMPYSPRECGALLRAYGILSRFLPRMAHPIAKILCDRLDGEDGAVAAVSSLARLAVVHSRTHFARGGSTHSIPKSQDELSITDLSQSMFKAVGRLAPHLTKPDVPIALSVLVHLGMTDAFADNRHVPSARKLLQRVLYPREELCLLAPKALHNVLIAQCAVKASDSESHLVEDENNRETIVHSLSSKPLSSSDIEYWLQHVCKPTPTLTAALALELEDEKAAAAWRDAKFTLQMHEEPSTSQS